MLLLLFYLIFIKRQKRVSSYLCYVALVGSALLLYEVIPDHYEKMHIFEYFIVSILCFRVLHHSFHDIRLYFFSIILSLFIALLDESLQFFTLYRAFSIKDIAADILSAATGQFFIMLVIRPDIGSWRLKLNKKIDAFHAENRWVKNQK